MEVDIQVAAREQIHKAREQLKAQRQVRFTEHTAPEYCYGSASQSTQHLSTAVFLCCGVICCLVLHISNAAVPDAALSHAALSHAVVSDAVVSDAAVSDCAGSIGIGRQGKANVRFRLDDVSAAGGQG